MSKKNKEKIKIGLFLIIFFIASFLIYQKRDSLGFRSFSDVPGQKSETQSNDGLTKIETQQNDQTQGDKTEDSQTTAIDPSSGQSDTIELVAAQDNVSALSLLEKENQVEKKEYDFGVFIQGINGKMGNDEYFWAIYVNDEKAQTGIDQIMLNKDDKLRLVYEEIEY